MTDSNEDSGKPFVRPDGKSAAEVGTDPNKLPNTEIANRESRSGGPYIPGYSEEEAARDIAAGVQFASAGEIHGLSEADKEEYYERFGTGPKEKEFDLKFLRTRGMNGEANMNTRQRMTHWQHQKGYEPVTADMFEEGGLFEDYDIPPDAEVTSDGRIRRIDTDLFFAPADTDDSDDADRERSTPLHQIPEEHRVVEDDRDGSQAVSYPTN